VGGKSWISVGITFGPKDIHMDILQNTDVRTQIPVELSMLESLQIMDIRAIEKAWILPPG